MCKISLNPESGFGVSTAQEGREQGFPSQGGVQHHQLAYIYRLKPHTKVKGYIPYFQVKCSIYLSVQHTPETCTFYLFLLLSFKVIQNY